MFLNRGKSPHSLRIHDMAWRNNTPSHSSIVPARQRTDTVYSLLGCPWVAFDHDVGCLKSYSLLEKKVWYKYNVRYYIFFCLLEDKRWMADGGVGQRTRCFQGLGLVEFCCMFQKLTFSAGRTCSTASLAWFQICLCSLATSIVTDSLVKTQGF